jgi:hypothetical protein
MHPDSIAIECECKAVIETTRDIGPDIFVADFSTG